MRNKRAMGFVVGLGAIGLLSAPSPQHSDQTSHGSSSNENSTMCLNRANNHRTGSEFQSVEAGQYFDFDAVIPKPSDDPNELSKNKPYWRYVLQHDGAVFLALHFKNFHLADGNRLRISDAKGDQSYVMTGRGKMEASTFWAKHIKGDTLVLELFASRPQSQPFFEIDQYSAGRSSVGEPEAICGPDDKKAAICYRESHPKEYEKSQAVARLLSDGNGYCTGWLISPDNLLITNAHCINTQEKALNTDYEFLAEANGCDSTEPAASKIFSGGKLIKTNDKLDYSLIQLIEGEVAQQFGYLEIDNREASIGEEIYIVGHPGGRLKELTIDSTDENDTGGIPRVFSIDEEPCTGSGFNDIGYYGDTEGGSSGSPVLARSNHMVVALHHCANCPNRGVPINLIFNEVKEFIVTSRGAVDLSSKQLNCSSKVQVTVRDSDLVGQGAVHVAFTSSSGDQEDVTLPPESGKPGIFRKTFALSGGRPHPGDGRFQVKHGGTISFKYIDIDNGSAQRAQMITEATIDCELPILSDVKVLHSDGLTATVGITSNEDVTGAVSFGKSCNALGNKVEIAEYSRTPQVLLKDLEPETEYFYSLEVVDRAGNQIVLDNGGECFSFVTPARPDTFFTQHFSESRGTAFDLQNTSIMLTPDGSANHYRSCSTAIEALPVNPANGIKLEMLEDDGGVEITPTKPVSIYGKRLTTLWVGSNGYLTAERDTIFNGSLHNHYSKVRLSGLFTDLNPNKGGEVSWQELADRVVVTFLDVPRYLNPNRNTFQMEMFFDGRIRLSWLEIGVTKALVGISPGGGVPSDFSATDLSAASQCTEIR